MAVGAPRLALAVLALAGLAACQKKGDPFVTNGIEHDYRLRHPIRVSEVPITLDVFAVRQGSGLDTRQAEAVRGFAGRWRREGSGPITAFVPSGRSTANAQATLHEIRRNLAAGGATGSMSIASYQPANPAEAAAIKLSYVGLTARTTNPCGQWPDDIGDGQGVRGWENKQYWNFGCSYQQNFAAQIADPRDLITPREETPVDTQKRTNAINSIRGEGFSGNDPSTIYRRPSANISGIVQ